MRIIGGRWKRSRLPVPDLPGLRPTPDRVRETLFNWLGQDLSGWRVLDAFAGSGALGLEAASRGAVSVTLVERDVALARHLEALCRRLDASGVEVLSGDALTRMSQWAQRPPGPAFDLVLLDPPYALDLFEPALAATVPLLAPDGWVYLEADRAFDPEHLNARGWERHRHQRFGQVHAHLLTRVRNGAEAIAPGAQSGSNPGI